MKFWNFETNFRVQGVEILALGVFRNRFWRLGFSGADFGVQGFGVSILDFMVFRSRFQNSNRVFRGRFLNFVCILIEFWTPNRFFYGCRTNCFLAYRQIPEKFLEDFFLQQRRSADTATACRYVMSIVQQNVSILNLMNIIFISKN